MTSMDERLAKVAEVLDFHALYAETDCFCGWSAPTQDAPTYDDLADAIAAEHRAHVTATLAPLLDEFRAEDEARALRALLAARVVCPVHGMPDCGPLLNGCQIPRYIAEWRGEFLADLRAALGAAEPDAGER